MQVPTRAWRTPDNIDFTEEQSAAMVSANVVFSRGEASLEKGVQAEREKGVPPMNPRARVPDTPRTRPGSDEPAVVRPGSAERHPGRRSASVEAERSRPRRSSRF